MTAPWRQMEKGERMRELTSGWPVVIPAASIVLMMIATTVVPLATTQPVLPDAALALLIAWRLYRPWMIAPWAGLLLGALHDVFTGAPAGISATTWPAVLLGLSLIEPRFPIRDTRMDWMLAAAAIAVVKLVGWQLLRLAHLPLPPMQIITNAVLTILFFPLIARLAAWMERQWLVADG